MVYLVFGTILKILLRILYAFELMFIVVNSHIALDTNIRRLKELFGELLFVELLFVELLFVELLFVELMFVELLFGELLFVELLFGELSFG